MRTAVLVGEDHVELSRVAAVGDGPAAIAISKGGAAKTYAHMDPNEDAALMAWDEGGALLAVADGHDGAWAAALAVRHLRDRFAALWTARPPAATDDRGWRDRAEAALWSVNDAILDHAGRHRIEPSHSTLSLAIARPDEGRLVQASMGDSHVFRVARAGGARDIAWSSLGQPRAFYLGHPRSGGSGGPAPPDPRCHTHCEALEGVRAVVLATDGLSEVEIGVDDPAACVDAAVGEALAAPPDTRALRTCRRVLDTALAAQRRQRSGDNIATAALWLEGPWPPQPG